jgi:threonylcarbamoyladenosine tRNA methylthiotransferase MtaB
MIEPEIITFGCRLNAYESEVLRSRVREAGIERAIIVNTCAVTGEAVRQSRQAIRKLRRDHPGARIIVTGCAAQIDPKQYEAMDEVDFVIGNADKLEAATWQALGSEQLERVRVNDINAVRTMAPHLIDGFAGRTRAFVQVQNGCDHRCTFCIIPFGRGPSRSVPAGEVVEQIRRLADEGFNEVVLTGVDLTAYGADLPGTMTLGRLTARILEHVPQLPRLRISSIDALESDDALLRAIEGEPRFMPHLHLSLQAGDDLILKRMKRRHLSRDAVALCDRLRAARPDMVLGADLIAGFPTESEAMFANTLRHVDDCGITFLHVFPFSPRPGTPAARMPQLKGDVIRERAQRLRAKGEERLGRFLAGQLGAKVEALMEKATLGRTRQFAEIAIDRPQVPGSLVEMRVKGVGQGGMLIGEAIA